jgi:hypothetical protein
MFHPQSELNPLYTYYTLEQFAVNERNYTNIPARFLNPICRRSCHHEKFSNHRRRRVIVRCWSRR